MRQLLTRSPLRGAASRLPAPALAAAATAALTLVGLLVLTLALVVVGALDPDGGLSTGGDLALAVRLWLLAHGASLQLAGGPVALAPLVLTAVAAWGCSQAARSVVVHRDLDGRRPVGLVVAAATGTHLVLTLLLALAVDTPAAGVGLGRLAVGAVLLPLLASAWGAGRESGAAGDLLDRFPGPGRAVARGVLAGTLTALALALAVVAVALVSDVAGVAALATSLGGASAGAVGLVGLSALLLPNAAAAVLGLAAGPGFAVGAGTLVSTGGVTLGAVPALPLLAALPDTQAVPLLAFLSQALPALAGLVAGTATARRLGDGDGGSVTAALWGVVTGVGVGVAAGVLALVGGGSLGTAGLAEVGAPALATGLATGAQAGLAAAVAAAVTRWRR
ncbi:cell division protein PerM [Klenkia brasiliensis]|uniref:Uncharacterized protein n=1 Tax=Klenkia brasiliensis TaxID=333142 RepID=A0A1G7R8X9_9ACTN|nr:DUF6350 family protein [Klenkia brasiliensis]SDG07261.1 hypothetical protein SAMN05660324_1808 [Klenkia brasiliensis]